jgi:biotin transport system substrate-specific component
MKAKMMARCALFVSLTVVCAWVGIPMPPVRFTLQTLAVMTALGLLGAKWGTVSVTVYLLLGLGGLPVFSGFRGGAGVLLDTTGGYLVGFLLTGVAYWVLTALFGTGKKIRILCWLIGLLLCYAFGTAWFYRLYLTSGGSGSVWVVVIKCVLPYILPDLAKLAAAHFLTERLQKFV